MRRVIHGLFVAEGSSDAPLANIVEELFRDRGLEVRLSAPDFSRLQKVPKDVPTRLIAGLKLMDDQAELVVIHRDSDNTRPGVRRQEITEAVSRLPNAVECCPVVPVRMTEAWLLLDEAHIRQVAGNPRGKTDLGLPNTQAVERVADPKEVLRNALLQASAATGRRREREAKRFNQQRRQLLDLLDHQGAVTRLKSWTTLLKEVETVAGRFSARGPGHR